MLDQQKSPTFVPTRRQRWLRRAFYLMTLYPPYLGAGIRIRHVARDLRRFEVTMQLRFWNRNYFGTHFGGSLYSLCDPFYALILAEALGPRYEVWDKAAEVRFKRPGRGRVHATFEVSDEELERVRADAEADGVCEPRFTAIVRDEKEQVVAEVEKLLWVRAKS